MPRSGSGPIRRRYNVGVSAPIRSQLEREGFARLPGFLPAGRVEALRARVEALFAHEGDRAGSEFRQEPGSRRLANCVNKGPEFRACLADPAILDLVGSVLGPDFKLSSMNVRSANPRNGVSQPLHCDQGAIADDRGFWVCNTVWLLDDFTAENGALRAVPGSHVWGRLPQDSLADPAAEHPEEVLITGAAGDVVVMNAHLWHGGTANRTDHHRRALHVFYCRSDKPQQTYQKPLLSQAAVAELTPLERRILALDDAVDDALSAAPAVRSGFLK